MFDKQHINIINRTEYFRVLKSIGPVVMFLQSKIDLYGGNKIQQHIHTVKIEVINYARVKLCRLCRIEH